MRIALTVKERVVAGVVVAVALGGIALTLLVEPATGVALGLALVAGVLLLQIESRARVRSIHRLALTKPRATEPGALSAREVSAELAQSLERIDGIGDRLVAAVAQERLVAQEETASLQQALARYRENEGTPPANGPGTA